MRLEQLMRQEQLIIQAPELAAIEKELSERIFNESQEEKLHKKYQDYLWQATQQAKKGNMEEITYITTLLFYLFPVKQLNLQFKEEKKAFYEAIAKGYDTTPTLRVGIEEDNDSYEAKINQQVIKEKKLDMNISNTIKKKIDAATNKTLHELEKENSIEKIVDAYGMIYVTPIYFNEKTNNKHKERFEKDYKDINLRINKIE